MPKMYDSIKKSLRKSHPSWPLSKVKSVAAATYEKRKPKGAVDIQTYVARERRRRKK